MERIKMNKIEQQVIETLIETPKLINNELVKNNKEGNKRRKNRNMTTLSETNGGKSKTTKLAINTPMFLTKTYEMINNCDQNICTWTEAGDMFVVKDQNELANTYIPQYFDHNKFPSFSRQLNFYGFRKVSPKLGSTQTSKYVTFHHAKFHRDYPERLQEIQRTTTKNIKKKKMIEISEKDITELKDQVFTLQETVTSMTDDMHTRLEDLAQTYEREIKRLKVQLAHCTSNYSGEARCIHPSNPPVKHVGDNSRTLPPYIVTSKAASADANFPDKPKTILSCPGFHLPEKDDVALPSSMSKSLKRSSAEVYSEGTRSTVSDSTSSTVNENRSESMGSVEFFKGLRLLSEVSQPIDDVFSNGNRPPHRQLEKPSRGCERSTTDRDALYSELDHDPEINKIMIQKLTKTSLKRPPPMFARRPMNSFGSSIGEDRSICNVLFSNTSMRSATDRNVSAIIKAELENTTRPEKMNSHNNGDNSTTHSGAYELKRLDNPDPKFFSDDSSTHGLPAHLKKNPDIKLAGLLRSLSVISDREK